MTHFSKKNFDTFFKKTLTQDYKVSKIYQGNVQSLCRSAQLFLDTLAVILGKESKLVGEIFPPALEMQFSRFYQNIKK